MASQDSSNRVPLSVQIAMATIRNDKKYEKVQSEKKSKRYSHYLFSTWTQLSDGQPAPFPRLWENMKHTTNKFQTIVKDLVGKVPPSDVKNNKGINMRYQQMWTLWMWSLHQSFGKKKMASVSTLKSWLHLPLSVTVSLACSLDSIKPHHFILRSVSVHLLFFLTILSVLSLCLSFSLSLCVSCALVCCWLVCLFSIC